MQAKWIATVFVLALVASAAAQNSQSPTPQDTPVLKTRPAEQPSQPMTPPDFSVPAQTPSPAANPTSSSSPDAIPQGTRFILKLQDDLDTHNLEPGRHFQAELTQDLVAPSGVTIIRKGELVRAHVASFERGYTGARLMLAMDDIETPQGWVPLIATFTGIPGDPSIKSTGQEGEITQRGPDKKRVITNAAIGAGIGAATGAAAGGGKGALAGLLAGAGLGTTSSFIFKTADLKLDKGTNLEVRLDRDLVVTR